MLTRTKIICTIGPACNSVDVMKRLIRAGMSIARINFSHGTHEQHLETIEKLKEAREDLGKPLAIMLDTRGPEIRVGSLPQESISVEAGQRYVLCGECQGEDCIGIFPQEVLETFVVGARVLFDDGYISSEVVSLSDRGPVIQMENTGTLRVGKGVNVPGVCLNLPALTERDKADIEFGCQNDIDFIAASFIRSADHVLTTRRLLTSLGHPEIMLIAKIENAEGVQNFDSIVQVADGIMIARGDLGVEVPLSQVPRLQKMMIRKCYLAGKPSVTATQMLESMIHNPRPTRAEASDVANAIYDSTSAVMLSGETAVGKYPVEAVEMMAGIIHQAELDFDYPHFFSKHSQLVYHDVASAVTLATVKTAYGSKAKAIFAFTTSGSTARMLSRLRPEMPVVALTPVQKNYYQLAFNWGVEPCYCDQSQSIEDAFAAASEFALQEGYVQYGDLVVVTAGSPFGLAGTTNMMIVENIGDVLVRGYVGHGETVYGQVVVVLSHEDRPAYEVKDRLLVIAKCDDSYLPLLKQARGIILQNHIDDIDSERYVMLVSKTLDKPAVVRADGAIHTLTEGQVVTLDPAHALVYKGALKKVEKTPSSE